jgi:hypothetical protein
MMKKLHLVFIGLCFFLIACGKKNSSEQFRPSLNLELIKQNYFQKKESFTFVAKLGLLKAAKIKLEVDPKIYRILEKDCYLVSLKGELDGAVDMFSELNDTFYSYIDTNTHKPNLFVRNQNENKYKILEHTQFDHLNKTAKVILKNTQRSDSIKTVATTSNINDMLSALFQIRNIDFAKYSQSDTLSIDVFIEGNCQNLKFKLGETEVIKTAYGKKNCYGLIPIVPENQLFRGEYPVKIWLSADDRRLPLKIRAKSWVGNVEVELKEYTQKQ